MEFQHGFALKMTKKFNFSEESKANFQLAKVPQDCIQTWKPATIGKKKAIALQNQNYPSLAK